MAHTALYGGTVYEKKGGADLVGGTVYKKDHGKVLVGGTAYEVGFLAEHDVVIAAGSGSGGGIITTQWTVEIDGNAYNVTNGQAWETVAKNTSVMKISLAQALIGTPSVKLNGETILSGVGECEVDMSYVTHVRIVSAGMVLTITTYDIPVQEDVAIAVEGYGYTTLAYVEYGGMKYSSQAMFTAKTGDLILIHATNPQMGTTHNYYVVTSDLLFTLSTSTGGTDAATGSVAITAIPEGHALVMINRLSYYLEDTYVSIDGVQYQKSATRVVPIGTVIYCHTGAGNKEDLGSVSITLNGQEVSTVTQVGMGKVLGEYYYTVTGMAKIEMAYEEYDQTSVITITET